MDRIATLSPEERAELFQDAAEIHGLVKSASLLEKDFWVCWILRRLFEDPVADDLLFKGGTSLSKVYGIIDRFSEDIDIAINRETLGFGDDRDPENAGSGKEISRRLKALTYNCGQYVAGELMGRLGETLSQRLGNRAQDASWSLGLLATDPDRQTLIFTYPASAVSFRAGSYIAPTVRLEFGARSAQWPSESATVTPYAAEAFPVEFEHPTTDVRALAVKRTFWEKATILHALSNGGAERFRAQMARHYYDMARLSSDVSIRLQALSDLELLDEVARHKQLHFRSAWARYDTATPGTLALVPDEQTLDRIRNDYVEMRPMFFDDPPTFDWILAELAGLEAEIN